MEVANDEIHISQQRVVFDNNYGTLFDDYVTFPSGTSGSYLRWVWKAPDSVAILPVTPDGRLVLLQTFRHGVRRRILEVPKGFGTAGVEARANALRELREETGMVPTLLESIGELFVDPGFIAQPTKLFLAMGSLRVAEPQHEMSEAIMATVEFSPEQSRVAISDGTIVDAVTVVLILSYLSRGE